MNDVASIIGANHFNEQKLSDKEMIKVLIMILTFPISVPLIKIREKLKETKERNNENRKKD